MGIFDKRLAYKPFEYPEVLEFVRLIQKSYWVHDEINFTADEQDFKTKLDFKEREAVRRALMFISQTEVSVKTFWGKLYDHLPKPEMNGLGATLAENEFRHSEAYSRLLTVLGFEKDFIEFNENPLVKSRNELFAHYLKNEDFGDMLFFFSIIIENTSLFTHFATILSFNRFRGEMSNIANIVAWTSIDEQIHAQAGIWIYNQIKKEKKESSTLDITFADSLKQIMEEEDKVVDYIFENGELDFFTKDDIKKFMRNRVDTSLKQLNMPEIFKISSEDQKKMKWFDEEIYSPALDDFFAKRPVDYTLNDKPISSDDLF